MEGLIPTNKLQWRSESPLGPLAALGNRRNSSSKTAAMVAAAATGDYVLNKCTGKKERTNPIEALRGQP